MQNKSLLIELYNNKMMNVELMQKYMQDPDVFNPNSTMFKSFLIQSFSNLHSDFHYLSFLNEKDIDLEIIKVAGILQILPADSSKKCSKLFDNMNEDDVHKFWLKFFSLFKEKNEFNTDSLFEFSWENKINFLSDLESTLKYLNYECPIINMKRLHNVNVDKEVNGWKDQTNLIPNKEDVVCFNYDEEQTTELSLDNIITDLKHFSSMFSNTTSAEQDIKYDYSDFFNNFISLSKNILHYKSDLASYNSWFLYKYDCKMFSNDENLTQNLYFIKRCSNIAKQLKSKIKNL